MTIDIQALRALLNATNNPVLNAGCLVNHEQTCDCAYIFDEVHLGGIGQVYINNGLPVSDGGNDCPPKDMARDYLKLLVEAVNALPELLDIAEGKASGN